TLAYLTRHNPPTTSNTTTPDPTATSIPATDTTVSTSIPATTPNAYADLLTRAREAAEAQSTHRLDYHAIATTLFGPHPTPALLATHLALAAYLAPPALKVTPEAAQATARLIISLMGEEEPTLPENPTLPQVIDYAIWSAAHAIVHKSGNRKLSLGALVFSIWGEDRGLSAEPARRRLNTWSRHETVRGWLMAAGLTGALPATGKDFNQFKPLADEMHNSTRRFKVPVFLHLARKFPLNRDAEEREDEDQGNIAEWRKGVIFRAIYAGWGLDDSPLLQGGVRYRLAQAAREERDRSGSSDPATIAAQLLGTEQVGIDQVVLVQELLRADLNLQDPQFPGLAQIIVDAVGDRPPPAIPGPDSTPRAKEKWEQLPEPQKLARRIDLAIFTAADSVVRTGKYRISDLVRSAYPDLHLDRTVKAEQVNGWLQAFGLEPYHPARIGTRRAVSVMKMFFDEVWEAVDAGEDVSFRSGSKAFAGMGITWQTSYISSVPWLQALGLIGAPVTAGSVRGRVLQRVRELIDQGVDDPAEIAQKAFGTRRVFPSQVVVAEQMMRLLDRGVISTR
ncbi:hypothetical protein ACFUJR_39200, partial [Streptomyces sp. NPDC057271]|uniref:hypothetical protein n=1 Tax=unclassified Streptomyces TaxID=2593676 RepID=UPI0036387C7B